MPCGHMSEVNGLDISMRLVQNAELHRRLERNAPNNLSNLKGDYYLPEGFMSCSEICLLTVIHDQFPIQSQNIYFVGQVLGTGMEE